MKKYEFTKQYEPKKTSDPRKDTSLIGRLYSTGKSLIYAPILSAGLALGFYSLPCYATRIQDIETCDNNTTSESIIKQHDDKWFIRNKEIEAEDFEGKSGYSRLHFSTILENYASTNLCYEAEIGKNFWGSGADQVGISIGDNNMESILINNMNTISTAGTVYALVISAKPGTLAKLSFLHISPGFNDFGSLFHQIFYVDETYKDDAGNPINLPLDKNGTNFIMLGYNKNDTPFTDKKGVIIEPGWNIHVKDKARDTYVRINTAIGKRNDPITNEEITIDYMKDVPPLEGYKGLIHWDSMGAGDPAFSSLVLADNIATEKDVLGGGGVRIMQAVGAGGDLEAKVAQFIRGDANMDGGVDLSDAIYTLNALFRGETLQCPDAADANDDEAVDISDAVKIILNLFRGDPGDKIPPPNIKMISNILFEWNKQKGMDLTTTNYGSLPQCQD